MVTFEEVLNTKIGGVPLEDFCNQSDWVLWKLKFPYFKKIFLPNLPAYRAFKFLKRQLRTFKVRNQRYGTQQLFLTVQNIHIYASYFTLKWWILVKFLHKRQVFTTVHKNKRVEVTYQILFMEISKKMCKIRHKSYSTKTLVWNISVKKSQ